MLDSKYKQRAIKVDLHGQPLSQIEIESRHKQLKSEHRQYLNYVLGLVVLAAGVTLRALNFNYDHILELVKVSVNVGMWIGLFTGFMTSGNGKRRLHLILISIVLSTSASFLASMLMTLFIGQVTAWITSINILASALACMWILTYYDEVIIGLDSLKFLDRRQCTYVDKAAAHFEELENYRQKIIEQGRRPLIGEYWAIQDWIEAKKKA